MKRMNEEDIRSAREMVPNSDSHDRRQGALDLIDWLIDW